MEKISLELGGMIIKVKNINKDAIEYVTLNPLFV